MGGALSKLTWKQVAVIGVVVCAAIGAGLYFLMITKQRALIASRTAELQTVTQRGQEKEKLKADLELARAERDAWQRRLALYERTKMIPLSTNSEVEQYNTMLRLWREQAEVLGPLMERHIASTGVTLRSSTGMSLIAGQPFQTHTGAVIPVPAAPATPAGIRAGWHQIPLGTITVYTTGGFTHALEYLRSFTRAPRLVSVGAPTITGRSPFLTVTAPLTVYYLVKGPAPAPAFGPGMGGYPGMGMDTGYGSLAGELSGGPANVPPPGGAPGPSGEGADEPPMN